MHYSNDSIWRKKIWKKDPIFQWRQGDESGSWNGHEDKGWQEAKISEVSPRVTPVWWVYGGHRLSGPPAQVQTAITGTAVPFWHESKLPRFRYHRPNGWRVPPTSWGSPASQNLVPWSIQLSTNVPVSLSHLIFVFKFFSNTQNFNNKLKD